MNISAIRPYNNVNNISKLKNTSSKVSFGDLTSCGSGEQRPWLQGYMFDLVMYRPSSNPFKIENRTRKGQYSRFLLNPIDERYEKLVIIMKPGSRVETKSGPWFYLATQRNENGKSAQDENFLNAARNKKREIVLSHKDELGAVSRFFNPLNPQKETKENGRVHKDKNGNVTFDRKTRRLLQSFAESYNMDLKNVVAYTTK
ncbi:MAG: hypothetical protein IJD57_01410 [Candidatus Gastranaerophilales bacterium]|nr:hypothetical protein [Candidatus Gastranaerophilales bacterium]